MIVGDSGNVYELAGGNGCRVFVKVYSHNFCSAIIILLSDYHLVFTV